MSRSYQSTQKRIKKRNANIENQRKKKEWKLKAGTERTEHLADVKLCLQKDSAAKKRVAKRPGYGKFGESFSFMMTEERLAACQGWRAHTFNERKQYVEFIKDCVCPYPVPEPLVFTSMLPAHTVDDKGKKHKSPDYEIITLSRRWLQDIISGESFYKRNRELFTRTEAHYFLTSKMTYHSSSSVVELYFYAKCKARDLSPVPSLITSRVFSGKFSKYLTCTLTTEFLDFISRIKLWALNNRLKA